MHGKTLAPLVAILVALALSSCAVDAPPQTRTPVSPTPKQSASLTLDHLRAAELAAHLANDECDRLYGERPFDSDSYPVLFTMDRYEWGRLDPRGINGFSSTVSFTPQGSDPNVRVYWSSDQGYISE